MRSTPIFVVAFAVACSTAAAQTTPINPETALSPVQAVERLAPQLVPFAGSTANFQSLVAGLSAGTPVQLLTTLPNGLTQLVSFTPTTALSPTEIAQRLEASRQQLIGLGIAQPSAEQLGVALLGGVVPTTLGGAAVTGALNAQSPTAPSAVTGQSAPSPAAQLQQRLNVQVLPGTAVQPTAGTTIAPATAGIVSPIPPSSITSGTLSGGTVGTSTSLPPVTPNPLPGAGSTVPSHPERVPAAPPGTAAPARR